MDPNKEKGSQNVAGTPTPTLGAVESISPVTAATIDISPLPVTSEIEAPLSEVDQLKKLLAEKDARIHSLEGDLRSKNGKLGWFRRELNTLIDSAMSNDVYLKSMESGEMSAKETSDYYVSMAKPYDQDEELAAALDPNRVPKIDPEIPEGQTGYRVVPSDLYPPVYEAWKNDINKQVQTDIEEVAKESLRNPINRDPNTPPPLPENMAEIQKEAVAAAQKDYAEDANRKRILDALEKDQARIAAGLPLSDTTVEIKKPMDGSIPADLQRLQEAMRQGGFNSNSSNSDATQPINRTVTPTPPPLAGYTPAY